MEEGSNRKRQLESDEITVAKQLMLDEVKKNGKFHCDMEFLLQSLCQYDEQIWSKLPPEKKFGVKFVVVVAVTGLVKDIAKGHIRLAVSALGSEGTQRIHVQSPTKGCTSIFSHDKMSWFIEKLPRFFIILGSIQSWMPNNGKTATLNLSPNGTVIMNKKSDPFKHIRVIPRDELIPNIDFVACVPFVIENVDEVNAGRVMRGKFSADAKGQSRISVLQVKQHDIPSLQIALNKVYVLVGVSVSQDLKYINWGTYSWLMTVEEAEGLFKTKVELFSGQKDGSSDATQEMCVLFGE